MRRIPVTLSFNREKVVGFLEFDDKLIDELLGIERLLESIISWGYKIDVEMNKKVLTEMTLVPRSVMVDRPNFLISTDDSDAPLKTSVESGRWRCVECTRAFPSEAIRITVVRIIMGKFAMSAW